MNKIFKVDKKRVILSFLRWQIILELSLLLLTDNLNINKTVRDYQFWWLTCIIIIVGALLDYWEIRRGVVVFKDSKIIDYSENKIGVDVNEFSAIKKTKTTYGNCLGLEYKLPKGIIARQLFQYNFYSTITLQKIITEITTLNSNIELDDTAKQMLAGTFENKL